ncbi:MAG: hypothetical protein C0501_09350 [Isosphaera sp.]|nr:hypothetical protein [Isosphaera sp.]
MSYFFPRREEDWWAFFKPTFFVFVPGLALVGVGVAVVLGEVAGAVTAAVLGGVVLCCVWLFLYDYVSRPEVHLAGGELRAVERVGPFSWSRRRPAVQVRRLVVTRDPGWEGPGEPGRTVILAECAGAGPLRLAPGYPPGWLLAVARDLNHRMGRAEADELPAAPPARAEVVEAVGPVPLPDGSPERPERPAGSTAVLERHPDGVTVIVPPARGPGGCFVLFGLGWAAAHLAGAAGLGVGDGPVWWLLAVAAVGLGVFAWGVILIRRRAVLAVVGDELLVQRGGVLGVTERRWRRDELADVCPGRTGATVNDEPVLELQIHLATGEVFRLLGWRAGDELAWMATVLRRALRLPKGRTDLPDPDRPGPGDQA